VTRVFISDCEGPISKNDNAFETTSHFVPEGEKLFTVISKYDDALAYVLKRPNHKAGDTLKLVLPFLRAYNVSDGAMREFSAHNLILIAGAKETLQHAGNVAPSFIVSTSYEHYIRAVCRALDFPYKNTYCTKLELDKYYVPKNEQARLKEIAREIAQMPMLEVSADKKSMQDFSTRDQETIGRLDEIFGKEIANTEAGKIYCEVDPMGGVEKAEAVRDITRKLGVSLSDALYVGDSITDADAFNLVRTGNGLAVSFNGNEFAVKNAEIAVLSENSIATAVISDVFIGFGKAQALATANDWNRESLAKSLVNRALLDRLFKLYPDELPKVKIITHGNMETLAEESSQFRERVRGEAIGRLG